MSEKIFYPKTGFLCVYLDSHPEAAEYFLDVRGGCFCMRISWRRKRKIEKNAF